jgi:transposase-like protein
MADCSVTCPFCAASSATLISLFGSQLLLSQFRCTACGAYFEGVREDLRASESDAVASSASNASNGGPHACRSS